MSGVIGGQQGSRDLLDAVREAVKSENLGVLKELQREFTSVKENVEKCTDGAGNTIAHLAIHRDVKTLQFCVEELSADINAANIHGKTPLHEAVRHNYVETAAYLLEKGARETVCTHTLSTALHTAASCGSLECLELLIKHHAGDAKEKVNEVDSNGCGALHKCCFDGDIRVVEWLIAHGADVNAKDIHDTTPLLVATKMGRLDVVDVLLKNGADAQQQDNKGLTAVHYCASRCLPKILNRLLESGASVKKESNPPEYNTPLHLAAMNSRPDSQEWRGLVLDIIAAGGQRDVLDHKNGADKLPVDYVNRHVAPLFSMEEVKRRTALKRQKEQDEAARQKEAQNSLQKVLADKRTEAEEAERRKREEDERIQRELEDRIRAEEDARIRMEEESEQRRLDEEEAKKNKKGKAPKPKGKGK